MKKLLVIFVLLCMPSLAVCADNWDEVNTWSYNGLADTLFNVSNMCELENTDMLLQLNNFVNEHDAELSVKQLVDKCIDLSNQTGGLKSCNVTDKSDIDNWTGTLGNQQNEFCDVFVSEFVQNHNKYADSDDFDELDDVDEAQGFNCSRSQFIDTQADCNNKYNGSSENQKCQNCVKRAGVFVNGKCVVAVESADKCNVTYKEEKHQKRCRSCVGKHGTYQNGRCFIEIVGWYCTGKGWTDRKNPKDCAESNMYHGCYVIRKYVDAEQPFTCNVAGAVSKKVALSGCSQHVSKHPPMRIGRGTKYDCELPLYRNWRVPYPNQGGALIEIRHNGQGIQTSNWCMPAKDSIPWNEKNHSGSRHLNEDEVVVGGQSIKRWYSF